MLLLHPGLENNGRWVGAEEEMGKIGDTLAHHSPATSISSLSSFSNGKSKGWNITRPITTSARKSWDSPDSRLIKNKLGFTTN